MTGMLRRDGYTVVGASARLQGAELIRADRCLLLADQLHHGWSRSQQIIYDRMKVITTQLEDDD